MHSQLGGELHRVLQFDALLGAKQGVEILNEVGVESEEEGVEARVEVAQVSVGMFGRLQDAHRLGRLIVVDELLDERAEFVLTVDVVAADGECLGDVGLLGVGVLAEVVDVLARVLIL